MRRRGSVSSAWKGSCPEGGEAFNWRKLPAYGLLIAWRGLFAAWRARESVALLTAPGTGLSLSRLWRGPTTLAAGFAAFVACFVPARTFAGL